MARQSYTETIAYIAEDGSLKVAEGVQVTVYFAGTEEEATLYADRTGSTTIANPIMTDSTGMVSFWADTGDYDLFFHDTIAPARIGDQTIGWQSSPPSDEIGFDLGDIKFSAQTEDHGRWLRMDGRSMSGPEIEAALNLQPGEAADILAFLGTGPASRYGGTSQGNIKLPDTRRRTIMGVGPTGSGEGSLSAREWGATGGKETVQLETAHLPAHSHAAGSYATSSNGSHNHGGSSGTASPSLTTSGSGTGIWMDGVGDHSHALWGNYLTTGGAPYGASTQLQNSGGNSFNTSGYEAGAGAHNHTLHDPGHSHGGTVSSHSHSIGFDGSHSHSLTGSSASTGGGGSHENMPPFIALGYCFIRV